MAGSCPHRISVETEGEILRVRAARRQALGKIPLQIAIVEGIGYERRQIVDLIRSEPQRLKLGSELLEWHKGHFEFEVVAHEKWEDDRCELPFWD